MPRLQNLKALGDIADIRTGYTFRGKIEEVPNDEANAHVVQIKDVRKIWEETQQHAVAASQLPTFVWEGNDRVCLEPGAVLLPSRGGYFRVSHFPQTETASSLPVVASSQFLVMYPKEGVLSEFLCWYLNQPSMQRTLLESCQGTNISMLKASTVKQIKLETPSLATQNQVLHLDRLWKQEYQLTQALLENREVMLKGIFQKLLMEDCT